MPRSAEYAQLAYDRVADLYDDLWSRHVAPPNDRLTRELDLAPGDRVADLACGTGLYTVEMARLAAPGEVVGVDYSSGMLSEARARARTEGVEVSFVHSKAEDFVTAAEPEGLDAVSLRFALNYLDWRDVLPRIGSRLRPGGRVGVLTSLSTSLPQFFELYQRFRKSPGPAWRLFRHTKRNLGETWRIYRQLRDTFGEPRFVCVPDSPSDVAHRLAAGGLATRACWTDRIRIWFGSGVEAVGWLQDSGYVTHASLEHVTPVGMRFLEQLFAAGMESFREARGIPLDLVVAGVVAVRPGRGSLGT